MATLKQYKTRSKMWYIKVYIKELKKHFEIPTGKTKKRDAHVELRKWEKYQQGLFIKQKIEAVDPMSVRNAVQMFIEHHRTNGETNRKTVKNYTVSINNLLQFCSSKTRVDELGDTEQAATPLYDTKVFLMNNYAEETVYIRLRGIKACLSWMVSQEKIPLNEVPKIDFPGKIRKYYKSLISQNELKGLFRFVDDDIILSWINFARYTGFRLSEIKKVNLDADGNYKAVTKAYRTRKIELTDWLIDDLHKIKATDYDELRVTKAFTLAYRKYLLSQNPEYLPNGYSVDDIPFIGSLKIGKLIRPLKYDRYCTQFEIDRNNMTKADERNAMRYDTKTFHSLRHTFCTDVRNLTNDLDKTRSIMGHSNIETTERYSHIDPVKGTEKLQNEMRYGAGA